MDDMTKSLLICTICDQPFKEPKILPCKHMFCKCCIQSHCLESATEDAFCCPRCSTVVQVPDPNSPLLEWADSLPTNHQIDASLDMLLSTEDNQHQAKCALCLEKLNPVRATKYCKSCQTYFCDECGNQHWLLNSSKEHRLWLVDDLASLKRDPLVRAKLDLVFSAKHRARTKRRASIFEKHAAEIKAAENDECDITGTCFIDGKIVLADQGNMRLSFFDENYVVQSVYKTCCYDVVEINEYFLAVSSPAGHCVKLLSVYNNVIEEDRKISLGAECYGLCRVGENFAVALASKPICIHVYSGSILKEEIQLDHGKVPMRKPRYLTYHETTERFFISDYMASCLKSVDKSGQIVWEKKVKMCNGLASFGAYILIARSDKNTLDLLNTNGQVLKSIVTPDDGLSNVRVIAIDETSESEDGTRMSVVDCAEFVHVFVLSDPMADEEIKTYVHKGKGRKSHPEMTYHHGEKQERSKSCVVL